MNPFFLFLVGTLLLCSCKNEPQMPAFGEMPQPVHVAEVVEQEAPLFLEVMGRIDSPLMVELKAQVSGRLASMHVTQGKLVKKGDLLFKVDPTPFQVLLDQALAAQQKDEAALHFAQAKLERFRPLAKQEYVSPLHYDEYLNEVETLTAQTLADKAAVDSAKINLDYCCICSPMEGKISEARVDPGNLVGPHDTVPLTVIRQLNPVDVRFHLAQKDFQKIKGQSQQKVEVLLPDATKPHCAGDVYFVDNHLNVKSGTILCKATLPNDDSTLWPGEYVRVRLMTKTLPHALFIPFAAVQLGQEGSFVYVVKPDQTVEKRMIHVEARREGQAILAEGLQAGEQVVIDGQLNLRPGSKVEIKK